MIKKYLESINIYCHIDCSYYWFYLNEILVLFLIDTHQTEIRR